jgi:predicted RNase H-like HicB family nuclease
MYKYQIIMYWSEQDQVFIVEVPELAGSVAHGTTQESALINSQEAIALWIKTAEEFGDPIPLPQSKNLVLI